MKALFKTSLAVAIAWLGSSCSGNDTLRALQLRQALVANDSCKFEAANSAMSTGFFDPSLATAGNYQLGLLLQNNMSLSSTEVTAWSTTSNMSLNQHQLQTHAVEGCWFVAGVAGTPDLEASKDGSLVDCATLPAAQRGMLPSSIAVDEGGTQGVLSVNVLDLEQMRALFGQTFSPRNIPVIGAYRSRDPFVNSSAATGVAGAADYSGYSYFPQEPAPQASGTRDPAWGERYPDSHEAKVVFQLRVVGQTAAGGLLRSNWVVIPITVCPKCLGAQCGDLVEKPCARGPCPDGSPCLKDGTCADKTATCSFTVLYSGAIPDYSTEGLCLPAQAFAGTTAPTCLPVGCDAL